MNKDHQALMENHVALMEKHNELISQHLTLQEEHIALLRERHAHWEELGYVLEYDQEPEPTPASVNRGDRPGSHLRIVGGRGMNMETIEPTAGD